VRCGDGLSDTIVHTSGTDKFSMRMQNVTEALTFTQNVPTGNVQNKTLVVGVWCKINNANYWQDVGLHNMPKITVDYDNASTVYAEATQTTDWQFLYIALTPTTTYSQITITLSTDTNKTGSDAYVYFDDMSVLYPPGHQINLGGLDSWASGMPIIPSIASNIAAADVWSYPL